MARTVLLSLNRAPRLTMEAVGTIPCALMSSLVKCRVVVMRATTLIGFCAMDPSHVMEPTASVRFVVPKIH